MNSCILLPALVPTGLLFDEKKNEKKKKTYTMVSSDPVIHHNPSLTVHGIKYIWKEVAMTVDICS